LTVLAGTSREVFATGSAFLRQRETTAREAGLSVRVSGQLRKQSCTPTQWREEPSQIAAAEFALGELLDYVAELVNRRQSRPREDSITALLRTEAEGDHFSQDEVITMVSNLLVAGHDTTRSQIGCSLVAMLGHPDTFDQLRRNEASVTSAVAETMRYEPNGPHFCLGTNLARMTLEETLRGTMRRSLELVSAPEDVEWRTVLGRVDVP
jgi:cytochrome P450